MKKKIRRKGLLRVRAVDGRLLYAEIIPMHRLASGEYANDYEVNVGPFDEHCLMTVLLLPKSDER